MSDEKHYFVSGGEYTDTTFKKVINSTIEIHGPYDTYEEAMVKWNERSRSKLDFCNYRYFIVEEPKQK